MTLPFFGLPLGRHQFLVADVGLAGPYQSDHASNPTEINLIVKTDRTWEITVGAGDGLTGSPSSGTWLNAGGTASDYEVRFTPSGGSGSPTITNDASSFTAVSANRTIKLEEVSPNTSSRSILVELREIGGGFVLSDTASFTVDSGP